MHRATIRPHHGLAAVILAVFTTLLSQQGEAGGIPNPAGTFSVTSHGSIAVCVDPKTFAAEPCSTKGTLVLAFSFVQAGVQVQDSTGACASTTSVLSPLPPSAAPPIINPADHLAIKLLDYDPATGTGDVSFTGYNGGKCVGAKFDSRGATKTNSGTNHFVVSQNGTRTDAVTTAITDPANSYGSFFFYAVDLKQ